MSSPHTEDTIPLTRTYVRAAHDIVAPSIHLTPVLTNTTISKIASTPQDPSALVGTPWESQKPAEPKINLFFKCENLQKIGAFKMRGATHAIARLISRTSRETVVSRGVTTHSSGNHAQAVARAARDLGIPAYIVMPSVTTPTKVAATQGYGAKVSFCGPTIVDRLAAVGEVVKATGAFLIPPFDHRDIALGQGTVAVELEGQVFDLVNAREGGGLERVAHDGDLDVAPGGKGKVPSGELNAVLTPLGGGGLLSGVATNFAPTGTYVFGAEPEFEGADDAKRGLAMDPPTRIDFVKSSTIADGVRTPVGEIPWTVISDKRKVEGVFSVTEENIKDAMRLVLERMKVFVEPSSCVPLAVVLYNEDWRRWVERVQKEEGKESWDVGIVFTGGNTSVEAVAALFATGKERAERQEGKLGMDGARRAENVAG